MLAWDRLPTPAPSKDHFPSHLRVVTSASNSVQQLPSPLPSPSGSSSSKTAAFFSSPFLQPPDDAPTPPSTVSKTHAFFSSGSDDSPTPPPSLSKAFTKAPESTRSLTADFFTPPTSRPTPPPSLKSISPENSPPKLPPLARFFPSRYRADPRNADSPQLVSRDFHDIDSPDGQAASLSSSPAADTTHVDPSDTDSHKSDLRSPEDSNGQTILLHSSSTKDSSSLLSPLLSPSFTLPSPPVSHSSKSTHSDHIRRETVRAEDNDAPAPGTVISGDSGAVRLTLIRALGHGAFSSVWLAHDVSLEGALKLGVRHRRPSESVARRRADKRLHGLKPSISGFSGLTRQGSIMLGELDGEGGSIPRTRVASDDGEEKEGRLVAVKMMDRALCEVNDRTRISFIREVEVLRHISHPSIVSYLHSFTTPSHHCLVLEHIGGGELFEFLNSDEEYSKVTEPLLRRMWGELCRAVGWMHGVSLVHRDIKLENILLTVNPFASGSTPTLSSLPSPLIKLSDFGLSRFIDPADPLLSTRCGSESYSAPEIVTGRPYDGRQTDAWACGVVLFALATRALPFDRPGSSSRRSYLMRIAQCDYAWPTDVVVSEGLRGIVEKLLVRDPAERSRIVDLWDEEWMQGEGAPSPPIRRSTPGATMTVTEDGELVDGEAIDNVARQEMEM